jgi:ABC-type phosphate/phosphonate transport system substrate-binding protein
VRRALCAAAAAALLALAGCGEDGGDEATERYAASVDRFCTDVSTATRSVEGELQKIAGQGETNPRTAAREVGRALGGFADAIDSSLGRLRGSEVPEDYQGFHDGATNGLGQVTKALREAAGKAEQGDVAALGQLGGALRDIRVPDPPEALRERAPACQALAAQDGHGGEEEGHAGEEEGHTGE